MPTGRATTKTKCSSCRLCKTKCRRFFPANSIQLPLPKDLPSRHLCRRVGSAQLQDAVGDGAGLAHVAVIEAPYAKP